VNVCASLGCYGCWTDWGGGGCSYAEEHDEVVVAEVRDPDVAAAVWNDAVRQQQERHGRWGASVAEAIGWGKHRAGSCGVGTGDFRDGFAAIVGKPDVSAGVHGDSGGRAGLWRGDEGESLEECGAGGRDFAEGAVVVVGDPGVAVGVCRDAIGAKAAVGVAEDVAVQIDMGDGCVIKVADPDASVGIGGHRGGEGHDRTAEVAIYRVSVGVVGRRGGVGVVSCEDFSVGAGGESDREVDGGIPEAGIAAVHDDRAGRAGAGTEELRDAAVRVGAGLFIGGPDVVVDIDGETVDFVEDAGTVSRSA